MSDPPLKYSGAYRLITIRLICETCGDWGGSGQTLAHKPGCAARNGSALYRQIGPQIVERIKGFARERGANTKHFTYGISLAELVEQIPEVA